MQFRTPVTIPRSSFPIHPDTRLLFVGSCFATNLGGMFVSNMFRAVVNPFGVMYNPVSVLHTVERVVDGCDIAFLTLGTNRIYRDVRTQAVVDNCEKRPASDFREEQLDVEACAGAITEAVHRLQKQNPDVRIVLTVSPIRYAKYGFHGSWLSKSVLLLAAQKVIDAFPGVAEYFPAYEIVLDELRDYRFYKPDMLHPSEQTVEYIWQRLQDVFFTPSASSFLASWQPLQAALAHRPLHPGSEEHRAFVEKTKERVISFARQYPHVKTLPRYEELYGGVISQFV